MAAASFPPFHLITFLRLICCFFLLLLCVDDAPSASSLSFSFNFSETTRDPCGNELVCEGDSIFANSTLELTRRSHGVANSYDGQGRVWYGSPVPLWDAATGEVASFTTAFSFKITLSPDSTKWADGMAFFLARFHPDGGVLATGAGGGHLGLFAATDHLNATGDHRVVAVEFDTFLNAGWDGSDQHVGIDVNSLRSEATADTASPGFKNRTPGSAMAAAVRYDSRSKLFAVDLRIDDASYHVNTTVDLKRSLPDTVAVGFSASTGFGNELHQLLSWSFNSTLEMNNNINSNNNNNNTVGPSTKSVLKVLVPVVVVSAIIAGLLVWLCHKLRSIGDPAEVADVSDRDDGDDAAELAGPRRYLYRDLKSATGNFAQENLLGQGGFGSVYKGHLLSSSSSLDEGQHVDVAIKRFSSLESSSQGRKEFEAEVMIIGRLRHRNLVQLFGWCDSPKQGLFLVYDLVPQGSLDKHIHNNERLLTWPERHKIILGLASVLRYLHVEWEQCVVHGDIKPSNIMLDSSYDIKLGDFGLARLVDYGTDPQTTELIKGSQGYIDPEFVDTHRRSTQSDVYSFGIVLLEIVSGRQPVSFMLLKWVWSLYCQDSVLDAVDTRLRMGGDAIDDADERQMERALVVGLWCAHPDPAERPSVAEAMHTLQSEDARLPALSPQMYVKQVVAPSFAVGEINSASSGSSLPSGVRSS